MTELELAYDECRLVTRREAKNFYYAFLTLPAERRRAIYVVYAFCRHCDDSVDAENTLDQKLVLISELRRKLNQCYLRHHPSFTSAIASLTNSETGAATSADGVFLALADVADRYHIPQEYFQEVLTGVESDLTKHRFENFEELKAYCYQVASAVGLICLQIFGYKDPNAKGRAIDLGLAMQLTNIARDVQEDLARGRIYLPQAEMREFGYSEQELHAGTINEPFLNLMRFQTQRARQYFQSGFQLMPYLSPRCRACPAVLARLYSKVLDRIEGAEYDVLHHRITLSNIEKLRVTAQTWMTSVFPHLL